MTTAGQPVTGPVALGVTMLGGFALSAGPDVLGTSSSGQRLLASLVLTSRRRPVARAVLAERLWPDLAAERAAGQLRSVLWRLPRPRGRSFVTTRGPTVRIADEVSVDLWDAEEVAAAVLAGAPPGADTADAADAAAPVPPRAAGLELLGLDLLPDWHEGWLAVEQESFRQRRLHALERAAATLTREGRFAEALSVGLTAVLGEPLRESAHRAVIEVHLREGNHAEALRQFHDYRRLIADELGLAPSPAIRGLVGSLLGRPVEA